MEQEELDRVMAQLASDGASPLGGILLFLEIQQGSAGGLELSFNPKALEKLGLAPSTEPSH